jgi:hypothetical protein
MYHSRSSLFAAMGLALVLTMATTGPSNAQHSDDGTGAGAGNAPPVEGPRGGAGMPDAATQMNAPPMPTDAGRQAAPEPDNAAPPPETTAPDDGTKKDVGPPDPD